MANSVDHILWHLIWVNTVCPDLSFSIFKVMMVSSELLKGHCTCIHAFSVYLFCKIHFHLTMLSFGINRKFVKNHKSNSVLFFPLCLTGSGILSGVDVVIMFVHIYRRTLI